MYFLFLYAMLADPVFEVRESASDRLLALIDRRPDLYGPRLIELAKESTEPEIRARVRRPINAYAIRRVVGYVPRTVPTWPRADMWPFRVLGCDVRADSLTTDPACLWMVTAYADVRDQRRATERYILDLIGRGMSYEDADALLSRMWKLENDTLNYPPGLWEKELTK